MSYFHTRPDPTTRPPNIRPIQLQPPIVQKGDHTHGLSFEPTTERESFVVCRYCDAKNKSDDLECHKCGAPLPVDSKRGER